MSIVIPSDFKGTTNVSSNKYDKGELQLYIDEFENELLDDLLGCELSQLIRDYIATPMSPPIERYDNIINPFCFDIDAISFTTPWMLDFNSLYCQNKQNRSRGLKAMLTGLIYTLYTRDQQTNNTPSGAAKSKGVASDLVPATMLTKPYNRSIVDYWNIQYFINTNEVIYPEFKGIRKEIIGML